MTPTEPAPQQAARLFELIGRYWQLAYAEGSEGRSHDTEDGDAGECIAEIQTIIRTTSAERDGLGEECARLREIEALAKRAQWLHAACWDMADGSGVFISAESLRRFDEVFGELSIATGQVKLDEGEEIDLFHRPSQVIAAAESRATTAESRLAAAEARATAAEAKVAELTEAAEKNLPSVIAYGIIRRDSPSTFWFENEAGKMIRYMRTDDVAATSIRDWTHVNLTDATIDAALAGASGGSLEDSTNVPPVGGAPRG